MRRLLFPGSFNPFTVGHADIVRRALRLAPEVVIAVGYNRAKGVAGAEERVEDIRRIYRNVKGVSVIAYSDLTVQLASRIGADAIVRGVRDVKDYEFERQTADVNRLIGSVETLLLPADPALSSVSSSVVRELEEFGMDVARFLPGEQTAPPCPDRDPLSDDKE